jgi:molybdopterin converting factor small subunit
MQVTVVFLGPAKDWVGRQQAALTLPQGSRLGDVVSMLFEAHPKLARARGAAGGARSMRWSVNHVFSSEDRPLRNGDEIAVIPPVSGG